MHKCFSIVFLFVFAAICVYICGNFTNSISSFHRSSVLSVEWPPVGERSIHPLAVWHPFNTTVNVLTTLFSKKTSHNGLWDQSGTLNVCLSGGLTTLDHTYTNRHTHTHTHTVRQSVASQSLRTKLWSPESSLVDHVKEWQWGCVCICVWVMTAFEAKEWSVGQPATVNSCVLLCGLSTTNMWVTTTGKIRLSWIL